MTRIKVTSCTDCPLKRTSTGDVTCKVTNRVIMGSEVGSIDLISTRGIDEECPMLMGTMEIYLDRKGTSNAPVEAYLGNRVRLTDGISDMVIAKFADAESAHLAFVCELEVMSDEYFNSILYEILKDGSDISVVCPA